MSKKQIHAFVSGRVQGVGFRYFTQRIAQEMELVGEVRNRGDGRVEIWAEGEEAVLKKFLKRIEQGPSAFARVRSVDVEWLPASNRYSSFDITF